MPLELIILSRLLFILFLEMCELGPQPKNFFFVTHTHRVLKPLHLVHQLLDSLVLLSQQMLVGLVERSELHDLLSDVQKVLHRLNIILFQCLLSFIISLVFDISHQLVRQAVPVHLILVNISHAVEEPRQTAFVALAERKRLGVRE